MNRYLTMIDLSKSDSNGEHVEVFTESDDYKAAIHRADEWVWQYAPNPETAIKQHYNKHDQWWDDQNRGQEKQTY